MTSIIVSTSQESFPQKFSSGNVHKARTGIEGQKRMKRLQPFQKAESSVPAPSAPTGVIHPYRPRATWNRVSARARDWSVQSQDPLPMMKHLIYAFQMLL